MVVTSRCMVLVFACMYECTDIGVVVHDVGAVCGYVCVTLGVVATLLFVVYGVTHVYRVASVLLMLMLGGMLVL